MKHKISNFNRFIDYQGQHPLFQPLYTADVGFTCYVDKNDALNDEVRAGKILVIFVTNTGSSLMHKLWFNPYVSLHILLFSYLLTLATSDRFNRTLNASAFSDFLPYGIFICFVSSNFRYSYLCSLLSILCILTAFAFYSQKRESWDKKQE